MGGSILMGRGFFTGEFNKRVFPVGISRREGREFPTMI